jgi:AcrR family transcriptional regulator
MITYLGVSALSWSRRNSIDMNTAAPGLREQKKAETRAALRAAALRLFQEYDPSAVTVNDICAAAHVSKRTFFNYFETKEEALFAWDRELTEQLVTSLAARPPEEPPLTALRRAFAATLPSIDTETDWGARVLVLRAHPELRVRAAEGTYRNATRLADALAVRLGDRVDGLHPQLLAGAATAVLRSIFYAWSPETGVVGLRRLVDDAFDLLAAGLPAPRPSAPPDRPAS